jgi:hypothetical protein
MQQFEWVYHRHPGNSWSHLTALLYFASLMRHKVLLLMYFLKIKLRHLFISCRRLIK